MKERYLSKDDSLNFSARAKKESAAMKEKLAELAKNYKDVENDFTYAAKVKGYLFSNAFDAKESNVVISGFLNQTVKQFYAGLSASLDLGSQKDIAYYLRTHKIAVYK